MRFPFAAVLALSCLPIAAQVPASTPSSEPAPTASAPETAKPATSVLPPQIKDTDIGFSYSLPADWETLASAPSKPDVPYPTVEAPKKGNACAQPELTARNGSPFSVVVVVALPFDCYGQTLSATNFADFASGAAEGLKQTFEVTSPVLTSYTLGNHNMWIERASGTVKGQPDSRYTLEIACTLMTKGAACWWTMAADETHLQIFEQGPVTLEGDAFDALVPAGAVQAATPVANKPS